MPNEPPKRTRHTGRSNKPSPAIDPQPRGIKVPFAIRLGDIPPHIMQMIGPILNMPLEEIIRIRPAVQALLTDDRFWNALVLVSECNAATLEAQQQFINAGVAIYQERVK